MVRLWTFLALFFILSPPARALPVCGGLPRLVDAIWGKLNPVGRAKAKLEAEVGPVLTILSGGNGSVLVVRPRGSAERVAYKVSMASLRLEGRRAAELHEAYEQHLRTTGRKGPNPFFASEYVPELNAIRMEAARESLGDLVVNGGLRLEETYPLIEQLAEGVAFLSSQGLVHRDLHYNNVLVRRDGTLGIVDFGLALPVGSLHPQILLGLPAVNPPLREGGLIPSPRFDAFGLRALALYVLLRGNSPFAEVTESPHSIDATIPPSVSVALWHKSASAEELLAHWRSAMRYREPERFRAFLTEYYGPRVLEPLIGRNPQEAASEVAGSEELWRAFFDGGVGISAGAAEKLRRALPKSPGYNETRSP